MTRQPHTNIHTTLGQRCWQISHLKYRRILVYQRTTGKGCHHHFFHHIHGWAPSVNTPVVHRPQGLTCKMKTLYSRSHNQHGTMFLVISKGPPPSFLLEL